MASRGGTESSGRNTVRKLILNFIQGKSRQQKQEKELEKLREVLYTNTMKYRLVVIPGMLDTLTFFEPTLDTRDSNIFKRMSGLLSEWKADA